MERFGGLLAALWILAIAIYAIAQIYAGWLGADLYWGFWGAVGVMAAALLFQFTLPLTVFSFLGAWEVWGWPWYGALLFAAPGLAFMALGLTGNIIAAISGRR
jgi:hypothetical protein